MECEVDQLRWVKINGKRECLAYYVKRALISISDDNKDLAV